MVNFFGVWIGALTASAWLVGGAIATRLHHNRQQRRIKT